MAGVRPHDPVSGPLQAAGAARPRRHLRLHAEERRQAAGLRPAGARAAARLRVVRLDLPAVDGLPEGAESTADVLPEKVGLLKKAFDGLAAPFERLVTGGCAAAAAAAATAAFSRKPDWIILDFAQNWIWPIAEQHKIACAMFLIFTAGFLAFVGTKQLNEALPRTATEDFMAQPPWIPFATTMSFRRHEAEWVAGAFRPNASGVSDVDRFWQVHHTRCRLVVVRSCPDVEPRLFPLLTDLFAKPIVSASLLMPEDDDARGGAGGDGDGSFSDAMQWLDEQPERSVVYVALGSEAPVTADQVHELALGLELSGVRFLWAVRRPAGHSGELLPGGFEARVAGRGVVRAGWVPQVRVLAHAAVGAFLTHCGWGSTVESLFRFGLPLVMLPFIADQGLIARAMAARRVGVEVPRDDADGSFRRDDVAAAVRRVMADGEGEGEAFARNAREMQKVAVDRAKQEQYVDELVDYLQRYK